MLVKNSQELPDQAKPVVALTEKLGFKWAFDYEYACPADLDYRIQVRDDRHNRPARKVAEMRAQLKRGEKLPPCVVDAKGRIVDGNTRYDAAKKNGFPAYPTVILDVAWDTAPESDRQRMMTLAAGFNVRNGIGIDRVELRNAVLAIGRNPQYDGTRIAALLGTTDATVRGYLAEMRAEDRAEKLKINLNGGLPATSMRALGNKTEKLNDAPFKALTNLAVDAGLKAAEIDDIAKRMLAAKGDQGAIAVADAERQARAQQITEYVASGKSVPPPAGKLRQSLGYVRSFANDPEALVERNPGLYKKHIDEIEEAIALLQGVLARQPRPAEAADAA